MGVGGAQWLLAAMRANNALAVPVAPVFRGRSCADDAAPVFPARGLSARDGPLAGWVVTSWAMTCPYESPPLLGVERLLDAVRANNAVPVFRGCGCADDAVPVFRVDALGGLVCDARLDALRSGLSRHAFATLCSSLAIRSMSFLVDALCSAVTARSCSATS